MNLSGHQIDVLTHTVLGEAMPNDPAGQTAVAWTILNRSNSQGFPSDPADVALQHNNRGIYQYSAWNTRANQGNERVRMSQTDPEYIAARNVVQGIANGAVPDPTHGATYYYAPGAMRPIGSVPNWAGGMHQTADIGGQVFFSPSPVPPTNIPSPLNTSGSPDERAPLSAYGAGTAMFNPAAGAPYSWANLSPTPPPLPIPRPPDAPPPGANAASWAQYTRPPALPSSAISTPMQLLAPEQAQQQVQAQIENAIPPSLPNAPFTVSYGAPPPQTDMLKSAIIGAMSHPGPEVLQPAANALAGLGNWLAPRPASSAPSVPSLPASSNWADGYLNAPQNIPALPASANQTVFGRDVTPNYTTPTHQGLSPDDRQAANDALSTWNTGQGIAGTVGLPPGVRPSVTIPSLPSSDGGWGQYTTPALPAATPAAPAAPTTQTVSKQVPNPAYTKWVNLSGPDDPYQNAAFNYAMSEAKGPAPPKYITVKTQVPVPRVPAPVTPLSPPPDELAALREQAQNPMQKLFGASPLGHITSFLGGLGQAPHYGAPATGGLLGLLSGAGGGLAGLLGGSQPAAPTITGPPIGAPNGYLYAPNSAGGYTHVGSVNPGLTPSQQYDAAAAKALASQPNPYLNFGGGGGGNPGGSTLAGRA